MSVADIVEAVKTAQSPDDPAAEEQERVRKFLALAKQRFHQAEEAESQTRRDSLDDLEFSVGKQWPADIEQQRLADYRPCLTMNRLPQFIRQVTNEQRQQRPTTHANPVGGGADVETAEVIQGIIRHIEVNSDAEIAYDNAFDYCVRIGFGFWRIITDYVDGDSFDQEILIKRVKNPFTVYFDPSSLEPDYSDARFAFVVEDLSAEEYKSQYHDSSAASLSEFSSVGHNAPGWATKDTIRIAEYFYIEETKRTLVQLEDGSIVDKTDAPEGSTVVGSRDKLDRRVMWAKINALEILEEREWPGRWIPIIPVLADDIDVNGRRHLAGLVRNVKDPQRMYNYWVTAATEMIALAPKAPFVGAEGQFEGHEGQWSQANSRNFAYLEYKPTTVGGQAAPPPQRQVFEPPVQAINLMTRQADNDLKSTTGIYDASLGQQGPDQSGKAILARQKQSDIATLNFSDNLSRSIRHNGRVLIDLIPRIYDAPRVQRIIKPDQTVDHVGIVNSKGAGFDSSNPPTELDGVKKIYDLGVGRYDVTVSVGPSYQSKRQEAVASMMALVQAYPNMVPLAGDLLVRNMDWPGAKEIAERLKRMLPPQLQGDETDDDPQAMATRLQSQLQSVMAQHDALVKELNQASETIRTKRLDLESRERIAAMQSQVVLLQTEAKVRGEGALALLQEQLSAISKRLDLLHEGMSLDQEAATDALSLPVAGSGEQTQPQIQQ